MTGHLSDSCRWIQAGSPFSHSFEWDSVLVRLRRAARPVGTKLRVSPQFTSKEQRRLEKRTLLLCNFYSVQLGTLDPRWHLPQAGPAPGKTEQYRWQGRDGRREDALGSWRGRVPPLPPGREGSEGSDWLASLSFITAGPEQTGGFVEEDWQESRRQRAQSA